MANGLVHEQAKDLLRGFNFNEHANLSSLLFHPATVEVNTGIITITALVPKRDVHFPVGATHLSLQSGFARIDFETRNKELQVSNIVNLAIDKATTDVVLVPASIPAERGTSIFLLKISFYQLVNGVQYLMEDGRFNAMGVVEVG